MRHNINKALGLTSAALVLSSLFEFGNNALASEINEYRSAVYLGISGEETTTRVDVLAPGSVVYRFKVGNEEKLFSLDCGSAGRDETGEYTHVLSADEGAYPIQNILMIGYEYDITVEGTEIVSARLADEQMVYEPVVSGIPGERTLKNFLKTACSPLGTVLYVYGGGWDFQDCGSSYISRTIGISKSWTDFFNSNDANYQYKKSNNGTVYYPVNGYNTYYYAGLDCSGYVSWALYNTLYSESLAEPGLAKHADEMAHMLADYGFGTFVHPEADNGKEYSLAFLKQMKPGDVVSLEDHIYIVIGTCNDGSVLIIHSTVTDSCTGAKGGGVQLCAINADGTMNTDCDAYRLADQYNRKYYPEWAERYPAAMKDPAVYTCFPADDPVTGIFHWNLKNGELSDPDGYTGMTAEKIMADIFN